jgi:REP element-mobilizing transposase RayT
METDAATRPSRLKNHARYFEPEVVYHVTSKTLRGEFFLHPGHTTNEIVLGVLGRAQHRWPSVELFAYVFMSNHFHLMVRGEPGDLPSFVGFIKREISRRLGKELQSPGHMWQRRYEATALPTPSSQLKCLKYILGHGVKEGLVEHPADWPGVHCAEQLMSGKSRIGRWLNSTRFGKFLYQAKARAKESPKKRDFIEEHQVQLSPLPPWRGKPAAVVLRHVKSLISELVENASEMREAIGSRVIGVQGLLKTPRNTRRSPPRLPWFEHRRKQVVAWASKKEPEVQTYLRAYWAFQAQAAAAA